MCHDLTLASVQGGTGEESRELMGEKKTSGNRR